MTSSKTTAEDSLALQIAALRKCSVAELQQRYRDLFGRESRSRNRDWLFKRIAFRIQENRYGGLSPRAQQRARELAKGAFLRTRAPAHVESKTTVPPQTHLQDIRLPPIGTVLERTHGGEIRAITVLANGFEYRGDIYPSLSRIAKKVTGTSWNGFLWLGLQKRQRRKTRS